ncbi:hypothetical protein CEXT_368741 [Caerostris extrusa]|uniref:Uncharacterized protein n=1 Tax=Caerostris extrusa TaxID=172846 RepID=A0AAV4Q3Y9_CAEEX|nr:hypothetical protein CEXT_368741 [Caerostris extrusa]
MEEEGDTSVQIESGGAIRAALDEPQLESRKKAAGDTAYLSESHFGPRGGGPLHIARCFILGEVDAHVTGNETT